MGGARTEAHRGSSGAAMETSACEGGALRPGWPGPGPSERCPQTMQYHVLLHCPTLSSRVCTPHSVHGSAQQGLGLAPRPAPHMTAGMSQLQTHRRGHRQLCPGQPSRPPGVLSGESGSGEGQKQLHQGAPHHLSLPGGAQASREQGASYSLPPSSAALSTFPWSRGCGETAPAPISNSPAARRAPLSAPQAGPGEQAVRENTDQRLRL